MESLSFGKELNLCRKLKLLNHYICAKIKRLEFVTKNQYLWDDKATGIRPYDPTPPSFSFISEYQR